MEYSEFVCRLRTIMDEAKSKDNIVPKSVTDELEELISDIRAS